MIPMERAKPRWFQLTEWAAAFAPALESWAQPAYDLRLCGGPAAGDGYDPQPICEGALEVVLEGENRERLSCCGRIWMPCPWMRRTTTL